MKTNGPNDAAFPMPHHPDLGGGAEGVTVREWYAAQALPGIIIGQVNTGIGMQEHAEGYGRLPDPNFVAKMAFAYADAMLAESKRDRTKEAPKNQDDDEYPF